MRRISWLSAVVAMAFVLGGCGKPTHESLAKDMMTKMQQFADILKGVKDESSAKAGAAKIQTLAGEVQKLKKQADEIGKPTKEVEAAMEKKHSAEMTRIQGEIGKEMMRISTNPKLLEPIQKAMAELEKIK